MFLDIKEHVAEREQEDGKTDGHDFMAIEHKTNNTRLLSGVVCNCAVNHDT